MSSAKLFSLPVALLLVSFSPACAETILVDWRGGGDYLTIQEGLNASGYGDTVLVAPGTYYEHLLVQNHPGALTLQGVAGAESTVVDNQGLHGCSVLKCAGLPGGITVKGLTLRRGYLTSGKGAGVQSSGYTNLVIEDCVVEDCYSDSYGGGIDASRGTVLVTGCEIRRNRAEGGGGFCADGAEVSLTENVIAENDVQGFDGPFWGGAINICGGRCTMSGNRIVDNYALQAGGALYAENVQALRVEDNLIARNFGGYSGGAAEIWWCDDVVWSGNTVVDNETYVNWGHALVIGNDSSPGLFVAENNVFSGNGNGTKEAIHMRFYEWSGVRTTRHEGWQAPAHDARTTTSGIQFTGNSFSDDSLYEVRIHSTWPADTLDFTGNWWGTADPDSIAGLIYDCNDDPNVPACVDFSAWCTDPSCDGQVTDVPEAPEPSPSSWGKIKGMYR